MTACFAALSDERVDAGQGRLLCLGRRGDGAPDAAPRRLQFRDDVAAGATEGEGDDRRLLPTEQLELRLPAVVGPVRLAHGDPVPRGFSGEAIDVRRYPRLVDLLADWIKGVHSERSPRQ